MSQVINTAEVVNPAVIEIAERINKNMDSVVSSIMQIGNDLLKAKDAFEHGEMDLLYAQLSFDKRSAQKYMAIAKSNRLSGTIEQKALPNSVSALYAIAKMKQDDYNAAIEAEVISSTTTANDIQAFKKRNDPAPVEYQEKTRAITLYIDLEDTDRFEDLDALRELLVGYEGIRVEDHHVEEKFGRKFEAAAKKDLAEEQKEAGKISRDLISKERKKAKAKGMKFDEYILKVKGDSPEDWKGYNSLEICCWLNCPDALDHLMLAKNSYPNIFESFDADAYFKS